MDALTVCTGIGGLDLGLERAGMTIVGQVEIDPWCRGKLEKHWPGVPRHDDLRTAAEWWGDRPAPDLVAGGIPCQPVSVAGPKRAEADPRWLWPATRAFLAAIRPAWVVIENVPGLRTRGLATILSDFDRLGYRARAGYIAACEMGAPHTRQRLFTLAHANGKGCRPRRRVGPARTPAVGTSWWAAEPDVGRVAYGVSGGVDRRRGLGNAVVPQVGEHIGRLIMEAAA